ncbi:uncharacterized protein LOC129928743 [Biomphalaria glabrata]|uniref:Uncharacterized protein LOC129922717 n=1 Tax=Biomphalaria glabrata TaxID=6526 RepID=A0A9W3BLV4_BIOGL|nr:uncharacterized protein LOC129922717 [Biomphalaria glabrata]XP_055900501.1 uncharacterized protein LOC129928743 [Biomphalaria glabrata]
MTVITKSQGLQFYPGLVGSQRVQVLRDTGSTSVVIRANFVRSNQYTGNEIEATAFNGTVSKLPEALIHITTPFFSGHVEALVAQNLPVDLIVGNIQGVRDCTTQDLIEWNNTIEMSQECNVVVTRSMQKEKERLETEHIEHKNSDKVVQENKNDKKANHSHLQTNELEQFHSEEFKVEQKNDETLFKMFKKAQSNINPQENNDPYFKEGLLMKNSQYKNKTVEQIIVPKVYRKTIINTSHDVPFAGHMGVTKTKKRILQDFYWPGITKDVKKHISTCHICQMKSPKGNKIQAPLQTMELTEKPFQKVAVDLIGPMPIESSRNHKYILTLVDTCTRWPEAIPLVNISAIDVTRALSEIFSRTGLPEVILSDRGSQFTADITKTFMEMYNIKMKFTTPYHPQSNGLCERFNKTLKQIISKIANDNPQNWDLLLPAALFAYRESIQDTTGFSPFEMLYGANPRGPITTFKESLLKSNHDASDKKTAFQHVLNTRNIVINACEIAKEATAKANAASHRRINEHRKLRYFEPGDKVKLLLPDKKNKFFIKWQGPFTILRKVTDVDYEININNRNKVFHINMLQKYNEATDTEEEDDELEKHISCLAIIPEEKEEDMDELVVPTTTSRQTETWHAVKLDNLSSQRKKDIMNLLQEYADIFTDVPGKTTIINHEIKLTSDKPTKSRPYPLPIHYRDFLQKEINDLLEQGIIEHSNSPYAAPIVLVKRSQSSSPRMCVDFRQLNKITCLDSYPIPNPEDLMSQFSGAKYFTKLDLTRGYYQIPMTQDSKQYTAFTTAFGLFQYNYMPFGLVNASSTFNRAIHRMFGQRKDTVSYIDDICVFHNTWEDHIKGLKEIFQQLKDNGFTVKPSKVELAKSEVTFLGYKVGNNSLKTQDDIIKRILDIKIPQTKKQVRSILGLCNFYRCFIPNYASLTTLLTNLTKKGQSNTIPWSPELEETIKKIKYAFAQESILKLPDKKKRFYLATDASSSAIGACLMQEYEGILHPVFFINRKLSSAETRYSTIERECLAIVWAISKFSKYLLGAPFTLQTDHAPLAFLNSKKMSNSRLTRWSLQLMDYQFDVKTVPGKLNVFADTLSRCI